MPAIAVLGDPNTGKSVFTYLLFKELVKRGNIKVFRQEGDPSAPTGPWYLESGKEELRKKIKSPWDWKKVEWVRDSIANLKKTFDVVLVDAGGGRPPAERVTRENAEILKTVDAVILLCRSDNYEECFSGWEKELREKAPHVKVIMKCISTLEGDESKFENSTCILVGLDRKQATSPREDLQKAISKIAEKIEKEGI
jgi:CO dehydrogenase nickel-insertion accessory protein CooC1